MPNRMIPHPSMVNSEGLSPKNRNTQMGLQTSSSTEISEAVTAEVRLIPMEKQVYASPSYRPMPMSPTQLNPVGAGWKKASGSPMMALHP